MATYGYARISTPDQSIERQVRNILKTDNSVQKIYQEAYSGRSISRPEFDKLMKRVTAGDTIIFDSVSRMSRNAEDGFRLYQELYGKGVHLVFIKEPQINTDTYEKGLNVSLPETDNAVIQPILEGVKLALQELQREQIRLAFAQSQKEVDDLRQRTIEGMETARQNGKQIGQRPGITYETKKAKATKAKIRQLSKAFGGPLKDVELLDLLKISRKTYYKYKREMKAEQETA